MKQIDKILWTRYDEPTDTYVCECGMWFSDWQSEYLDAKAELYKHQHRHAKERLEGLK